MQTDNTTIHSLKSIETDKEAIVRSPMVSELHEGGVMEGSFTGEGHLECLPPCGGPDAEAAHASFEDRGDVAEDESDEIQEDADWRKEDLGRTIILPPGLLNSLPGGSESANVVVSQAEATIGTGSLFGRPTPAEILLQDHDGIEEDEELTGALCGWEAEDDEDDDDDGWGGSFHKNKGWGRGKERTESDMRRERDGSEVSLGTVSFYDRSSSQRTPSLQIFTRSVAVGPIVQLGEEENSWVTFKQWLHMARTNTTVQTSDSTQRVVPLATSSSLI
mmetsp:Transcript_55590/g.113626  ORF Transcript_55590/g.113626 Transcript_55590/m.113626 type:complete len:276 (-) Transcript_55590:24-851(-)